jgi:Domain of unknown function (DUF222)/HNH endonuclease
VELEALRHAVQELRARPADAGPGLDADIVELRRLIDALEGIWTGWVGSLDGSGSLGPDIGTGAWLRAACRMAPGAARSRVVLARRMAERPAVAAAALDGELSVDHARLVTTALAELADAAGEDVAADAEAPLVDAARRCDSGRLRREIAHARHALAPEAAVADAERLHERRRFDVATTFDGAVHVDGLLDPEAGELLLAALAPLSGRTGPDDDRTPGQRRADGLAELCRAGLAGGAIPELGRERPHLTVVVPAATLDRRPGARAADAGWGAVLTGEAARRIACDSSVTRVVTTGDSQPLDVGRRTRVIPPAIRTALAVRDRGCVHPDCDRPPQWTDAHHAVHWAEGGPTSLDNLVLLCRRHHRAVHEGRQHLERGPAGAWQLARAPDPPLAA